MSLIDAQFERENNAEEHHDPLLPGLTCQEADRLSCVAVAAEFTNEDELAIDVVKGGLGESQRKR